MTRLAIHSVPRSGSSWLGQIFNSSPRVIYKYQPLFSYAFKGYLDEDSSGEEIRELFKKIATTEDPFLDQTEKVARGDYPAFEKADDPDTICYKEVRYHHILPNLLEKDPEIRIVGLVRHPCGVINSWLKAPKEFRSDLGWDEMEEWRNAPKKNRDRKEEYNGFEKWKEATRLFESLAFDYPERFRLVTYDRLLKDTRETVEELFAFAGLAMGEQTIRFLENSRSSKSSDPYGVYRNNPDNEKWRRQLNPRIIDEIMNDLKGTDLEKYL